MSLPLVTRFGADPLLDLEVANKRYVDSSGGGANVTIQTITPAEFTTSSTSFVDWTDADLALPTRAGGFSHLYSNSTIRASGAGQPFARLKWVVGSVDGIVSQGHVHTTSGWTYRGINEVTDLDGDTAKIQVNVASLTVIFSAQAITSFEVS